MSRNLRPPSNRRVGSGDNLPWERGRLLHCKGGEGMKRYVECVIDDDNLDESFEHERQCLDIEFMMLAEEYSDRVREQFNGAIAYAALCGFINMLEWDFLYDAAGALRAEYCYYINEWISVNAEEVLQGD